LGVVAGGGGHPSRQQLEPSGEKYLAPRLHRGTGQAGQRRAAKSPGLLVYKMLNGAMTCAKDGDQRGRIGALQALVPLAVRLNHPDDRGGDVRAVAGDHRAARAFENQRLIDT
jgi:hypothetical protein